MGTSTDISQARPQAERRKRLYQAPDRDWSLRIVLLGCAGALAAAWQGREELWIRAEEGLGYALGIAGLSCMVLMLVYSVRKRVTGTHGWGPIHWWFRSHMALGLIGPTAIVLHSNFSLGSWNARIALASMALVVGSGIVGRVLYSRVHRGLFGRRQELAPLIEEAQDGFGAAEAVIRAVPDLEEPLMAFESFATESPRGAWAGIWRFLTIGFVRAGLASRTRRVLAKSDEPHRGMIEAQFVEWLDLCAEVARFRGYERMLSIWHAVHLPLCVLLFGAAATHVLAVHMY